MKHKSDRRPALFVLNDATAPRLNPELAKEIGLNESLLFLQLEFWLRQSGTLQEDGQYWIYESVTDIQGVFSFWGRATINRIVHSLERQELIQIGNFNKHRYDRTRWFTLNRAGIDRLQSVHVFDWWVSQNGTAENEGLFQNGTASDQNGTRSAQNGTTIPDLSSDLSPEKEPPLADSAPAPKPERNPAQERLERMRATLGDNPLDVMARTAEARSKVEHPDFMDASQDADEWTRVYQVFGIAFLPGIDVDRKPLGTRNSQIREIKRLAEEVRASPRQAEDAIKALAKLEPWMVGPSATPFKDCWAEAFQNTLIADPPLLQAQIDAKGRSGDRAPPRGTGVQITAEMMRVYNQRKNELERNRAELIA